MERALLFAVIFILVLQACGSSEKERKNANMKSPILSSGKTVLLDNYFNNERKEENGILVAWHYLWTDTSMGGFSELGNLFLNEKFIPVTLKEAPSSKNLAEASIYIIADPDNEKESENPNYMTDTAASVIANWVNAGGVLVLLANDSSNCELEHFNLLANKFGIQFNKDNHLVVQDPHFEQGEVKIEEGNPIFKTAKNVYIKGICSVTAAAPAQVILKANNINVMAIAQYGKGTVFALGDPWIYNEYIGHRRLPKHFENDKAARDWVKWLVNATQNK